MMLYITFSMYYIARSKYLHAYDERPTIDEPAAIGANRPALRGQ